MVKKVIILIGPPGAGKGFYGDWIIREKKYVKYSSGDVARKYAEMDSVLGNEIKTIINNGNLISSEIMSEILFREINNSNERIIFDGFPRNLKQQKFFLREYRKRKWKTKPIVLFFNISEKISNERILGRLTCSVCGQSYHIKLKPPKINGKCDLDNAQLIRRADELINNKRWEVYNDKTLPLINDMKVSENYIFIELDCSKKSKIIFSELEKIL